MNARMLLTCLTIGVIVFLTVDAFAGAARRKLGGGRGREKRDGGPSAGGETSSPSQPAQASTGTAVTQSGLQAAAQFSRDHDGVALIVMENGKTLLEDYSNGFTAGEPHRLASGTKTFCGILCAALIEDGIISSFDERVSDTITEWKSDSTRASITIRQLLSLASGLDPGPVGKPPSYEQAIQAKQIHPPGQTFQYGPAAFQVFGALVKRKLHGQTATEYLQKRVLTPIGMRVGSWKSVEGDPNLPSGAFLQASEWIKYGELLRQKGAWKGKQIVRRDLVEELVKPSKLLACYGISTWLCLDPEGIEPGGASGATRQRRKGRENSLAATASPTVPAAPNSKLSGFFLAAGAGKQRLYVNPTLGLTIVRFGEPTKGWNDAEFLSLMLR